MKLLAATLATLSMLASASAQADQTKMREDVRMVAPALEKYAQGTLLGDVWKRPGLSVRDRSIVTLAALIARNQTVEMAYYLNVALDNGVKPAEISEIITHLAFYSGWSNAMAAVAVAKDVFAERKIAADQFPAASPNLLALDEAAEADRAKRVGEQFGAVFPGVVQYTTDVLFRDLWLRPGLAPRDRSLVTVSSLIASGQIAQLTGHLNIGMNNGLTQTEIAEDHSSRFLCRVAQRVLGNAGGEGRVRETSPLRANTAKSRRERTMPHVIVKLWPGKSEQEKKKLADEITKTVMTTPNYGKNPCPLDSKRLNRRIGRRRSTSLISSASPTRSIRSLDTILFSDAPIARGRG